MKKTKDTNYLYASSRVKALEQSLLSGNDFEKMLEAKTGDECLKYLEGKKYPPLESFTMSSIESGISAKRANMFKDILDMSPMPEIAYVFQVKYDFHNIKTIIKADAQGVNPEPLLIDSGRYSSEYLLTLYRDENLRTISPELEEAVAQCVELLAKTKNPQKIDFILDKLSYSEMLKHSATVGSPFLTGYVKLMIDSANLRSVVRLKRMEKGIELLSESVIEGGNIPAKAVVSAFISGEDVATTFSYQHIVSAAEFGMYALENNSTLADFERQCDNNLIHYLLKAKYVPFGVEPIAAYIAANEAEFTALRIIAAGKLSNIEGEKIRKRLRISYG